VRNIRDWHKISRLARLGPTLSLRRRTVAKAFSRYPRKAFPDEARERGIVIRVASAIVDVAKAPEFCKGQRRVDRPEFVGAFRDKAIYQDLPVPGSRRADVLDMERTFVVQLLNSSLYHCARSWSSLALFT
jgi:hypothetical protein